MHRKGGLPPPRPHLNKPFAPRTKAARRRTVALDVAESTWPAQATNSQAREVAARLVGALDQIIQR